MFDYISIVVYGRVTKNQEWSCKDTIGMNRLHYIHSGSVLSNTGTPHMIEAGKLYLFPQNLEFKLMQNENTCVDHTFIDFTTIPPIKMDSIMEIAPEKYPIIKSALKIFTDLAENYSMFPSLERNEFYDVVKSYLNNLLFLINHEVGINTINEPSIICALNFIHQNFHNDISIDDIAKKLNYHKNFFIKKFKKHMNITPYQYMLNYRMNMALNLIKGSNYSITEISEMVGYSDSITFSHAFKKLYGIYPSKVVPHRKQYKNISFKD